MPDVPHPLPEPLVELIAHQFRVLGEPTRIRLLERLRDGPAGVGELATALGTSQQNVSKHLGVLYQAGLLTRDKHGTAVHYAIGDDTVFQLCDLVCGRLREQHTELAAALRA
ncbi:ArsR/SmtB family transcription factor [Qaidamihabitans albus]|uniref:ArsR/SmtB family transcription factor n=1 Tax=Qaidamihabitans albus TaxID=2795733 RepID=UPI0018F1A70D|nr:metalloregulator ArsR/SmtB family transcription factor [Qaidamihabitans albus]